jgi:anti-sigma28 factor (negative regulator of flagellin synthesis)
MRVTDNHIPSAPGGAGQAEQTGEVGRAGRAASSARSGNDDRVEVSGLAGKIADALAASAEQRQVRVQELSAAWASGELDADASRLSRKLVDVMLGSQ